MNLMLQSEVAFIALESFLDVEPGFALSMLIDLKYLDSYSFHGDTPKLNG